MALLVPYGLPWIREVFWKNVQQPYFFFWKIISLAVRVTYLDPFIACLALGASSRAFKFKLNYELYAVGIYMLSKITVFGYFTLFF